MDASQGIKEQWRTALQSFALNPKLLDIDGDYIVLPIDLRMVPPNQR